MVSLRTIEPGVTEDGRVAGIIWGLTAHSPGEMGFSLYGVVGDDNGVATSDEAELLGVTGSEGVRG